MLNYRILLSLIILLSTLSCANQINLTGGEKDTVPPGLVSSEPIDSAINVKPRKVIFNFDEFIRKGSTCSEAYLNPPSDKPLQVIVSQKRAVVDLPDSLKDSTSYCLFLKGCIEDYNEGNKWEIKCFCFSTGTSFNEGRLFGSVKVDGANPNESILIALYRGKIDSVSLATIPDYIGYTDKNGAFEIYGIEKGNYYVLAIKDDSKDLIFQNNELVGFEYDKVVISENTSDTMTLNLSRNQTNKYVAQLNQISQNNFIAILNQPIGVIGVESLGKSEMKWRQTVEKDTVEMYFYPVPENDKLVFEYANHMYDTASIVFSSKQSELTKVKLKAYKLNSNTQIITSNIPISKWKVGELKVYDNLENEVLFKVERNDEYSLQVQYNSVNKKAEQIHFQLKKGFFEMFDGQLSDSMEFVRNVTETELLTISVDLDESMVPRLVYLLKADKQLVRRVYSKDNHLEFSGLKPGKYYFKIISDENGDGIWTPGDVFQFKRPEPIMLSKELELSNWDLLNIKI